MEYSRVMPSILLAGFLLFAQDPYGIDLKPEFRQSNGFRVLSVSGTTNLPDGALIRCELFRGEISEGRQLFVRDLPVRSGAFSCEIRDVFPRGFPPGRYVLRASFDPALQSDPDLTQPVGGARGAAVISETAALEWGSKEDLLRARRQRAEELAEDLRRVLELLDRSLEIDAKVGGEQAVPRLHELGEAVQNIARRRLEPREQALDSCLGFTPVSTRVFPTAVHAALHAIRLLIIARESGRADDGEARRLRKLCAGAVRAGLLDLDSQAPLETPAGLARALRHRLQELVAAGPNLEPEERARKRRSVEELLLRLAHAVPRDRYPDVERASRLTAALLDRPGSGSDHLGAARKELEKVLDALSRP